ncbi:ArsR family transcriptional regulator [Candidatus Woesearchaeota archaeon]|nr:ArsR family transcriptional regulator [Candidatus Woesearchaeota archaeon]
MIYSDKIHIWDFPPTKTALQLKKEFRTTLINKAIQVIGSEPKTVYLLNKRSRQYDILRKYSRGTLYTLRDSNSRNIPLWIAIELTKIISKSNHKNNKWIQKLEKNIDYYCCNSPSTYKIKNPKLPILITPEFVSIFFHFCGDGHLSNKRQVMDSYRQMNLIGLKRVYSILTNIFGDFDLAINQFNVGKLHIPKIIGDIYRMYYSVEECRWNSARIPVKIKNMSKDFLLAGLISFLVDEANISEIIEIYSKNYELLMDIIDITSKCGYNTNHIRKKYAYGIFDCYRFTISSSSYHQLYNDILLLNKQWPYCNLAHKIDKLKQLATRCNKKNKSKTQKGMTKNKILNKLIQPDTIYNLSNKLNLSPSTIREHLWKLEEESKIIRIKTNNRSLLWQTKTQPISFDV